MSIGQHPKESTLGKAIYQLAKQFDVNTIIDIGTWNGMGTTKCAIDGLLESKKVFYKLISLECNKAIHEEAKNNLVESLNYNIILLHGTITDYTELEPLQTNLIWGSRIKGQWVEQKESIPIALNWLAQDIEHLKTTPNVLRLIPKVIDLLIIDGGEFSGFLEFQKLWTRCKYIALDDINSYKNYQTRKYIIENPDKFTILLDDIENNCFICKKI